MFLKESTRFKDGKEHHYWSLVENRRVDGGLVHVRVRTLGRRVRNARGRQHRNTRRGSWPVALMAAAALVWGIKKEREALSNTVRVSRRKNVGQVDAETEDQLLDRV